MGLEGETREVNWIISSREDVVGVREDDGTLKFTLREIMVSRGGPEDAELAPGSVGVKLGTLAASVRRVERMEILPPNNKSHGKRAKTPGEWSTVRFCSSFSSFFGDNRGLPFPCYVPPPQPVPGAVAPKTCHGQNRRPDAAAPVEARCIAVRRSTSRHL